MVNKNGSDTVFVGYGVREGKVQKKETALYRNRSPLMRREGAAVRLVSTDPRKE